ncbi:MAG TPA: hypothetical protein G4O08_12160 [Anaerolineae bacterium]|nr:hypothetical protein [Anaerolineae bacterium]
MSVRKAMPPPSDRQTTTARALVVACAALGIIALAVGFWILSAGGSNSLDVLVPGGALCSLSLLIYLLTIDRRRTYLRSSAVATARVLERKRRKVRAGLAEYISSGGGSTVVALLMILLLVVEFFLVILEWIGLRERRYKYVDHGLVLEFEAIKSPAGKVPIITELQVGEEDYESKPPGSRLRIRYSTEKPNRVMLEDDASLR